MPSENTRAYRVLIIALLFSATTINSFDRAALSVAAPFIIKDFGIDAAIMGVALSAFVWTYAIGNPIGGVLADRFGTKLVLGASFTLWSVFSGCTGLAQNVTHIILARLGVGLGEAPVYPCATKIVAGNFPTRERGTATGINMAGVRIGLAVSPLIMAFLISSVGWRTAFIVTGFGCLVWVAAWALYFKDLSRGAESSGGAAVRAEKLDWAAMLRSRAILSLLAVKLTQDFLTWIFLTWIPGYLVTGRHFSIIEMGFYTSLAFGMATVSQFCVGFFSDWLIRVGWSVNAARKTIQAGLYLLSATIIICGFADDVGVAMFFLVLAITAETTCAGHFWTIVSDVVPPAHVGSVSGMLNGIGAIAGVLSPILTGVIVKATGSFQLALTLGGGSILIAAAVLVFLVPNFNRPWHEALGIRPVEPTPQVA